MDSSLLLNDKYALVVRLRCINGQTEFRSSYFDMATDVDLASGDNDLLPQAPLSKKQTIIESTYTETYTKNKGEYFSFIEAKVMVALSEKSEEIVEKWKDYLKNKIVEELRERNNELKTLFQLVKGA